MLSSDELRQRAKRLRLPNVDLARMAGVDKHTVRRCLGGANDPRRSTLSSLEEAVRREELALRDYLLALHPLPEAPAPAGERARIEIVRSAA